MCICFDSGRFNDFNNTKYFSLMDREMWFTYICEKYKIKITDIEKILDKQVVKKVGYDPEDVMYFCPTCGGGRNYIMYDDNIKETYNYCCNCGQKLDWGGHKHGVFQG